MSDIANSKSGGKSIPSSRLSRIGHFGGLAAGIAGNVLAGGVRELANGRRPSMSDLMLTPSNARRLADKLALMRGAAMKLGQLLSMDSGDFIPHELADILARLRADAEPMTDSQLSSILIKEWGKDWQTMLAAFDAKPIAAASIGQVHRGRALDGRNLAIKIQYPAIADSIDSDVDNANLLLKSSGLLPRHLDIAPLISEAKAQLHHEADYTREAAYLKRYAAALADDLRFAVPDYLPALSTGKILAMTFMPSVPLDDMAFKDQGRRDAIAHALMDLVLRELFDFSVMQSDPNLANYRFDSDSGKIVLLDFGATRDITPEIADFYRWLLKAGLSADKALMQHVMRDFGLIDDGMSADYIHGITRLFDMIVEPLLHSGPFDFGEAGFLRSMRDQGMALTNDRRNWRLPPAELFFVQRKLGGTYHMAARLRARIDIGSLLRPYL